MPDEAGLPEFDRPPVVETVLSARFRDIPRLTTARIVQFWERELAADLPEVDERPPYDVPLEPLHTGGASPPVALRFGGGFPSPRFWFSGGSDLVQLQPDWIAFNWRQTTAAEEYVRYRTTRQRFADVLERFVGYLEADLDAKFDAIQCEVTYINHIFLEETDLQNGPLGGAFRQVQTRRGGFLPVPETARFATSYLVHSGDESRPAGRLHVVAEHALISETRKPAVVLNLTARGRPRGAGTAGVMSFCDLGRRWVVAGFKDLTTPTMHERWGLRGNPK